MSGNLPFFEMKFIVDINIPWLENGSRDAAGRIRFPRKGEEISSSDVIIESALFDTIVTNRIYYGIRIKIR